MLQSIYIKELQFYQNKYIFSHEIIIRMDGVFNVVTEMGYDESIFDNIQPIQDLQHDVYEFRDYVKFAIWLIAETKIPYNHLYYCYLYDKLVYFILYDDYFNDYELMEKININVAEINDHIVAFTSAKNNKICLTHINYN